MRAYARVIELKIANALETREEGGRGIIVEELPLLTYSGDEKEI